MRIAAVHVDSYGGLRNRHEEFKLPPVGGLVVLEGPNEAGKTTMLRFIQALLFGNGELHGTLILDRDGRRYSLRQKGRRPSLALVDMETGNTLDSTKLSQMLGGLDAKVYRSVFAFGLDELQQLQFLAASGIQEHIFSASVAGAGRNARKALTRIDGELKELLKPRASAVLNDLADNLIQATSSAEEAWQANQAYEPLRRREAELFANIGRTQHQLQTQEAAQRQLDAVIELWPSWSSSLAAASELESLDEIDGVATDSLTHFDLEMRQVAEYELDIEVREADLERDAHELAEVAVDHDLLVLKNQVEDRLSSLGTQQQRLEEEIPSLRDRLERQRQRLNEQLQQLEGGWNEQRLLAAGSDAAPPKRLQLDEQLLAVAGDIDQLNANLSAYTLRRERCATIEQQAREANGQLKVLVGQLGAGWDERKVADFDQGPNWRQKAAGARRDLARLDRSRLELEAHYNLVKTRFGDATDKLAELAVPHQSLSELKASRERLKAQEQGYLGLQARLADRTQKTLGLQALVSGLATAEAARGGPLRWAGPLVGALGLLAAAYFSFPTNEPLSYVLAALALMVVILLRPRALREGTRSTATIEELERQVDGARTELAMLDEEVRADLNSLSLAIEPGAGAMQELLNAAQSSLKQAEAALDALAQHDRSDASVTRLTDELDGVRWELAELNREQNDVTAAWKRWCAEQSIPDAVSPESLEAYLGRLEEAVRFSRSRAESAREFAALIKAVRAYEAKIEQLRPRLGSEGARAEPGELVATWKQLLSDEQKRKQELARWQQRLRDAGEQLTQVMQIEEELRQLTQRSDSWEEEAHTLLELADRPVRPVGLDLLSAMRELNDGLRGAEEEASRAAQLQAACDDHRAAIEAMRARQDKRKQTADAILAAARADDRSDLELRLAAQERREELERAIRDTETQLTARFGQHQEEARAVLEEEDPLQWRSRREAVEAEQAELHGLLHGKNGLWAQHAQTVEEVRTLESSSDIAERAAQLESLRQELRTETRNWLVLKLAEAMIANNLKEYERTHVPDVLKHASEKLAAVTGGRYVRVHNTDASALRVFTSDDHVLDAAQLSRGTQEQLYLAVRLGLIDHFAEQSGKLPLVMDEVLVNADPQRAVQLADILAEAARRHQIIYLTCHPHTAELLRNRVPDCTYIKLERLEAHGYADVELLPPEVGSLTGRAPAVNGDGLVEQVLQVFAAAYPKRLARSDIMREVDMTAGQFTGVINELQDAGLVDKEGKRRTATYAAARPPA